MQVDEHLSIHQTFASTRCIQQRIVLCQQIEVGSRTLHIPEINLTVNRKRILAGGINGKLIEYQLIVLYLYRTVVEPVTCSRLACIDRHTVQNNITMHLRLVQRTINIKPSINISGKGHHLVRDECIGHLQWEMLETSGHFQSILSVFLRQDTVGGHHFFVIMCKIGIQIVRILVARQPGSPQTYISNRLAFVGQFLYIGFGGHLQGSGSLYIICFGGEQSRKPRHIRKYLRKFIQAQSAQFYVYILQGKGIILVGLHTETQTIVAVHINIGIDAHILMQINPVTIVRKVEFTESDNRLGRNKVQQHTITATMSFGQRTGVNTEQHTSLPFSIHIIHSQLRIFITDFTRQCTAEHKLRVLGTVYDTTLQLHAGSILLHCKKYRIELQGVHAQSVNSCTSIDADLRSKSEAQFEIIIGNTLCSQEIADGILVTGFQIHAG